MLKCNYGRILYRFRNNIGQETPIFHTPFYLTSTMSVSVSITDVYSAGSEL